VNKRVETIQLKVVLNERVEITQPKVALKKRVVDKKF
jgi:hypothetical protein